VPKGASARYARGVKLMDKTAATVIGGAFIVAAIITGISLYRPERVSLVEFYQDGNYYVYKLKANYDLSNVKIYSSGFNISSPTSIPLLRISPRRNMVFTVRTHYSGGIIIVFADGSTQKISGG